MSNQVFPTQAQLPGTKINVRRSAVYATKVQVSASGYETRLALQSTPRVDYVLDIEFMRTRTPYSEVQTVVTFIHAHLGAWDSFLFWDPYLLETDPGNAQKRVRFVDDSITLERMASGYWGIKNLKLVEVK